MDPHDCYRAAPLGPPAKAPRIAEDLGFSTLYRGWSWAAHAPSVSERPGPEVMCDDDLAPKRSGVLRNVHGVLLQRC
jgi:hypothetical protein